MIKHIVFFKMMENAEGSGAKENALKLSKMLESLVDKIPQLKKAETGLNLNDEQYDLCLYSECESMDALNEYLVHPEHLKVREFVFKVIDHRVVVDYEV